MTRWWIPLVVVACLVTGAAAQDRPAPAPAKDEEFNVELFYPLVTRRPVIERELEFRVNHFKGADGRETEISAGIEVALLPRWQMELTVPFAFLDPRDGASRGGVGDVEIEQKFLLYTSVQPRALLALGFETRLPTGSERRGLGGEFAIEPFLTGGIGLGPIEVIADIAWERNLNAHVEGHHEQELSAGIAGAWLLHRRFTPLVELRTSTVLVGGEKEERGATRVTVVPGFNTRIAPGATFRFGIELPVTHERAADYTLRAGLTWEF